MSEIVSEWWFYDLSAYNLIHTYSVYYDDDDAVDDDTDDDGGKREGNRKQKALGRNQTVGVCESFS